VAYWPSGQNPGRKPATSRRPLAVEKLFHPLRPEQALLLVLAHPLHLVLPLREPPDVRRQGRLPFPGLLSINCLLGVAALALFLLNRRVGGFLLVGLVGEVTLESRTARWRRRAVRKGSDRSSEAAALS
jgi:hypothetical protein